MLERCDYVDHSACFGAMVEVCKGKGHWDVTPECVNAVTSCYPIGTQALAAVDVVKFCAAEFGGECFYANGPGCGETLCTCTAGGFPFDWSSCWHLLLLACDVNVESDCESVLAGCYPGASVEDFKQCQDQVMQDVGVECHCPMCSIHESCEDALDTCLGA
ncbi:hypothetical protein [Nannocystis pusilla]|uniref:hypothetical protein n=1 Tax=Nannocystis pusilla TaxID=889268 RepID=UPI003BEFC283